MSSPWPGHSRLLTGTPPGPFRPRMTSSASLKSGTATNRGTQVALRLHSGDRPAGFDERSFVELVPRADTELREDPVEVEPDGAMREAMETARRLGRDDWAFRAAPGGQA